VILQKLTLHSLLFPQLLKLLAFFFFIFIFIFLFHFSFYFFPESTLIIITIKNLRDWQSGGIRIIELEGLEGDLELSDIKPYTTIQGGEMGAYFSLSLHSDEDSLWVGEPYYGSLRAG